MDSGGGRSDGPDTVLDVAIAIVGLLCACASGFVLGMGVLVYLIQEGLVTLP